jgi:hypothetical protein
VNIAQASEPTPQPLRLWPGVALAVLLLLFRFVVPIVVPGAVIVVIFGSLGCAVAILLWWLFLSRAPWSERLGAVLLMIVALFGSSSDSLLSDEIQSHDIPQGRCSENVLGGASISLRKAVSRLTHR